MRNICGIWLSLIFLMVPSLGWSGDLDAPAGPTSVSSAMYTLEDIYQRLTTNIPATKRTGAFTEPSSLPGSTGHTLNEVYQKAIPTQVPKTGQTTSFVTGDDGDLEKGVAWPSPRFTDNSNGTVTDNLTGLIWLKNANCFETKSWEQALSSCNTLANGNCGLTDGSVAGNWRLPNLRELQSLIDYGCINPALPSGHPFTSVQSDVYWSSTALAGYTGYAWRVVLYVGLVSAVVESSSYYVWPVRSGQ